MDVGLEVLSSDRGMTVAIRNFFQLEVSISGTDLVPGVFRLFRGRELLTSKRSSDGKFSWNLESYGHYSVEYNPRSELNSLTPISAGFRFNGFGADPNQKSLSRIAILGVSRLALVISELLRETKEAEVVFVSRNPEHIGRIFAGGRILAFDDVDVKDFDQWILMNGVTLDVESTFRGSHCAYGYLTSTSPGPIEPYLNSLTIMQLHEMAHDYHKSNVQIGADFITRYLRKRFGSVLPASVDLSGVRFAYGCISTVINKNAIVGKNVTIGQNVTIGGRNGIDPVLEDNVWIGAGAVVLGCKIGKNATIAANAVVTKDVAAGATIVAARVRELG